MNELNVFIFLNLDLIQSIWSSCNQVPGSWCWYQLHFVWLRGRHETGKIVSFFIWFFKFLPSWLFIDFDCDCIDLQMKHMSKEEFVHALRRQNNGFSRGSSKNRGVALHKCGRLEARMGQFLGKKWGSVSPNLCSIWS